MITLRHAHERGHANFGWLDSKHSFSFGSYYDAAHMGISALRVINDDKVSPGAGFTPHGHKNMEIISYVLEGAIAHKDSEGNVAVLPAGEFQLMSAGTGISHSEFNASKTDDLKFLQIWIQPNVIGTKPEYQQKHFGQALGLTTIASADGKEGSLRLKQDATLSQLILAAQSQLTIEVSPSRHTYVHQVQGELSINHHKLNAGDGAHISEVQSITLNNVSDQQVTALIFDLP
ncbi:pirin family protein [Shewanella aestuarii]|uniref:Pirin family protein n=1 Tax=Shewanella aestuarii TaxID=1028752 RepID=A0A6G9QNN3_9GAMM|nr:pirin family protein [Shewanella aestuarii]QIR15431.1 pirin family protein [Shewanella aestuarii]